MSGARKFLIGVFLTEAEVMNATKAIRSQSIPIYDVYTPYAVHGLDEAMGIRRTRLPYVCFAAALLGCVFALLFQTWIFTIDWPIIVGGKPFNSLPAFMPIAFEITVLFGGLITVGAFLMRSKLWPGAEPVLLDSKITDDRFVMAIEMESGKIDVEKLQEDLHMLGAVEVMEKEVGAS